ncbi:MAG: plasmid pRiA4b ORF-3 family protein [bacterium]|nr:plasmid pRiA4b ORF-3 family protein [bacterium]
MRKQNSMTPAKPGKHYLLKVNLKGARRVWRTIALRGDHTLEDLHEGIFVAFDRDDPHLYSFYFPKAPGRGPRSEPRPKEYTAPPMFDDRDPFGEEGRMNAAETRLDDLGLRVGQRFEYLFDFGDYWWHEVVVESISAVTPELRYGIIEKRGASPAQYESVDE